MSLTKETPEKKVNFEFNKEFINVLSKKIKDNDTAFFSGVSFVKLINAYKFYNFETIS